MDDDGQGEQQAAAGTPVPPVPGQILSRFAVFILTFLAFLCHWLSVPPVGWFPVVFLTPVLWSVLCLLPSSRSYYRQAWLGALCFWLLVTRWVGFPHPATILGYLALSVYLACYFPIYLLMVRRLLAWRIPLLLAVPVPFLCVEYLRKHIFGGFSFASMEHAFYRHPILIQLADLPGGEYLVGLMILLVGTALGLLAREMVSSQKTRPGIAFLLLCVIGSVLGVALGYGYVRLHQWPVAESESGSRLHIALLQDATTFRFPVDSETNLEIHRSYMALSQKASHFAADNGFTLDLIVWPEGCFAAPHYDVTEDGFFPGPDETPLAERIRSSREVVDRERDDFFTLSRQLQSPLVLGIGSAIYDHRGEGAYYNSALFVREPDLLRYDKMHLVMFGEYLPFADQLPDWFPLKTLCVSVRPGREPVVFPLTSGEKRARVLVNICFESSSSRFIRRQVQYLRARNEEPDLLLNLSNDGWFRHCSQVDWHLATCVFRAVENRKPMLSAVHGGLSAWIDPAGRIRRQLDRRDTNFLIAEPCVK
ncbi:MAG: apolipoprotein N-acyltransferase [Planctomycetia bacterium]|nr:apolipoprotein N-acyltransferase [Planctomycetia bacterium]